MTPDEAIAHLRSRDGEPYRRARQAHHLASAAYDAAGRSIAQAGADQYRALETYMRVHLRPHRVEWTTTASMRENGYDVNGDDFTTAAHLCGEVWPEPKGGRFNMRMRAHIPFSMSPLDGDEFRRGVALLKAAADAMSEGGL